MSAPVEHHYVLLDVFTDRIFGGNALAVFPDAQHVAAADMPRIARELNLSETVFVLPPRAAGATHRLRIFTPGAELPFAGHPTIGTACLLAMLGHLDLAHGPASVVFEEGVGNVPVTVREGDANGGIFARLTAAQPVEIRPSPLPLPRLAALLSLPADAIVADPVDPCAASCGVPFLFVPLRDRDALAAARLDVAIWAAELETTWAPQVFPFTTGGNARTLHGRMFAPAMGIVEDPATGSAATALAALLAARSGSDGTHRWRLEQGVEMGRPSLLELEADVAQGAVVAARVGGSAVRVGEGVLRL